MGRGCYVMYTDKMWVNPHANFSAVLGDSISPAFSHRPTWTKNVNELTVHLLPSKEWKTEKSQELEAQPHHFIHIPLLSKTIFYSSLSSPLDKTWLSLFVL